MGSRKVSDSGDLIAALERYRPGKGVTLTFERGGRLKTGDVCWAPEPELEDLRTAP